VLFKEAPCWLGDVGEGRTEESPASDSWVKCSEFEKVRSGNKCSLVLPVPESAGPIEAGVGGGVRGSAEFVRPYARSRELKWERTKGGKWMVDTLEDGGGGAPMDMPEGIHT
jgi:hypothetical protein